EYRGPMLHAKTFVGDHEWARVGSSNLNVSSLFGNYEIDLVAEHDVLTATLATQFLHDMAQSREIVLMARRRLPLPPRLVDTVAVPQPAQAGVPSEPPRHPRLPRPTPVPRHKRSLRERRAVVVVALMRVAGGVLGDPDDADDAAQEGFLSALVKLGQYDARRPFGPWLMRIVANAATDRRRRRNVRRSEPLDPSLVGGGPRPDAVAVQSELG